MRTVYREMRRAHLTLHLFRCKAAANRDPAKAAFCSAALAARRRAEAN